jgi:hypothetical protein
MRSAHDFVLDPTPPQIQLEASRASSASLRAVLVWSQDAAVSSVARTATPVSPITDFDDAHPCLDAGERNAFLCIAMPTPRGSSPL